MDLIKTIEEQQKRAGAQKFNVGDTVRFTLRLLKAKQNVFRFMKESFFALRTAVLDRLLQFARTLTELV